MLLYPVTALKLHRSLSPLKNTARRLAVTSPPPLSFSAAGLTVTSPPSLSYSAAAGRAVTSPQSLSCSAAAGRAVTLPRSLSSSAAGRAVTSPRTLSSYAVAGEMATVTAVEHVVLFKVRDGTDAAKIAAMAANLNSLASLDGVLHLHCGPVLRRRSAAAAPFNHLLFSRYRSKEALASYAAHPAHVDVVRDYVLPICDDVMAVDWVGRFGDVPVPPRPGSAARLSLMKLKESAGDEEKRIVLDALSDVDNGLVSFGENFSPARAKGYQLGSIAVFSGVEELDEVDGKVDAEMEARKEKVRPHLDGLIVLDFVFNSISSGL